jgi:hemerythrin-like domain-containing protein
MARPMTDEQPLRLFAEQEHQALSRGLNRVHDLACAVGVESGPQLSSDVFDVLLWIDRTLEPHLAWEDRWLYPEIEHRLGTSWATRASVFDHGQVRRCADQLRRDRSTLPPNPHDARSVLRKDLFGLETLVRAHLEREEQFLLPLLDEPVLREAPGGDRHAEHA